MKHGNMRRFLTSFPVAACLFAAVAGPRIAIAARPRHPSSARSAAAAAACPTSIERPPRTSPAEPERADPRAGEELTPAWEHRPRDGTLLRFDGVVDPAGNVYWIEVPRDSRGGELVSASRDGEVRYRAPLSGSGLALAGDVLVTGLSASGCRGLAAPSIEAHRARDGALAWRRELLPAIAGWMRTPGSCRYGGAHAVAVNGNAVVVAASILDADTKEHESGFLALAAATGEVAWAVRTSAEGNVSQSGAPRVAEDGRVYAARRVTAQREPLLVMGADGGPREVGAD
ncbi:MAG: hypothetical protein ACJ79E_16635, partial [Anaeromyxobacteraceae bacterium]